MNIYIYIYAMKLTIWCILMTSEYDYKTLVIFIENATEYQHTIHSMFKNIKLLSILKHTKKPFVINVKEV